MQPNSRDAPVADHGIFCPLLIDVDKHEATPIALFFNMEQFMRDVVEITDSGTGPTASQALLSLSVLRNFNVAKAPAGFGYGEFRRLLEDCFHRIAGSSDDWSQQAYSCSDRWRLLITNAVWFQDLYNYDLSTISDSTYPVGIEDGEISFCAYNGGRWRKIVEHKYKTASLAEWHRTHSRHDIYAKGKAVNVGQNLDTNRLVQIDPEPARQSK